MADAPVQIDLLSSAAKAVLRTNPVESYSTLVPDDRGFAPVLDNLEKLNGQNVLCKPVSSREDADAVLAGIWIWHDWLEPAHGIVQSLSSGSGAFWHAIIHRRDGDFSNSKYWYSRCADHPIFQPLAVAAADVINAHPADKKVLRIVHNGFDPAAFVEMVREIHRCTDDPGYRLAVAIQQLEWRLLFDHCVRAATRGT